VIVPMGPKIFTFLTAAIGMTYVGDIAVWRVQHSKMKVTDSKPGAFCVRSELNSELLGLYCESERKLLENELRPEFA
jgi:hypothetical protein